MNSVTKEPSARLPVESASGRTYDPRNLIRDGSKACIILDDQAYFLRITRAGKLILTK